MYAFKYLTSVILASLFFVMCTAETGAWYDETHIAVAKAAGYSKLFGSL